MHLGMFYGFLVLLAGTMVIALQEYLGFHLFYGWFYLILSLLLDLAGLFALAGILTAGYKRYIGKRDGKNRTIDDAVSLSLIFIILLSGFVLEGLRIYAAGDIWAHWSPVGMAAALIFQKSGLSMESARSGYVTLWYCHMLLSLGFIAYIPYSKLFHMIVTPIYMIGQSGSSIGTLTPAIPATGSVGVGRLEQFTGKQLMELDACLSCLRCEKHCPAYESGVPFSPRLLVQALKRHARQRYSFWGMSRKGFDSTVTGTVISKEALLSCTSCGLCEVKCPVNIEHVRRIVDMRRSFMSGSNGFPSEFKELFANLCTHGNPWGLPIITYDDEVPYISDKKNTDILYWTGCFGNCDPRNQQVTRAMLNILKSAGVDFAVLGGEVKCCGDTARRLGNEPLFQQLARANINVLNSYKFNTIVTACPHCYNTLKNEYPELGGNFSVLHHSEYILQLIEAGQIKPLAGEKRKVTFHDPCYLGRYNQIFSAPRKVLASIPDVQLLEMRNTQSKSNCCGAGGGQIWQEDKRREKVSALRLQEAIRIKPDIIASACPLCLVTLTDASCRLESDIKNLDIAEMIL